MPIRVFRRVEEEERVDMAQRRGRVVQPGFRQGHPERRHGDVTDMKTGQQVVRVLNRGVEAGRQAGPGARNCGGPRVTPRRNNRHRLEVRFHVVVFLGGKLGRGNYPDRFRRTAYLGKQNRIFN